MNDLWDLKDISSMKIYSMRDRSRRTCLQSGGRFGNMRIGTSTTILCVAMAQGDRVTRGLVRDKRV